MKKILIITHGDLCKGYNSALEVITTQKDKVDVIGIHPEDNQEVITSKIDNYIKQNANNSIVILTDIPVGSTTQFSIPFVATYKNVYLVTGINLALVLELVLNDSEDNIAQDIINAIEESKQTLLFINDQLNDNED